jgi:hypothetical protein
VVGLSLAGWWFFYFGRQKRGEDAPPSTVGSVPSGLSGWEALDAFLAELLADPDPTRAIRMAVACVEQGMGRLPGRPSERTPQEWLLMVDTTDPPLATRLRPLVDRYCDIRFGNHQASSRERDDAVSELRELVYLALDHPSKHARLPVDETAVS